MVAPGPCNGYFNTWRSAVVAATGRVGLPVLPRLGPIGSPYQRAFGRPSRADADTKVDEGNFDLVQVLVGKGEDPGTDPAVHLVR
jgi:hypothetical protein